MDTAQFITGLEELADLSHRAKLSHFGVPNANALGVKMPLIRDFCKPFRGDKDLALSLFQSNIHEAKMSAAFIYPAKNLDEETADLFMQGLYSWDLVDQFCGSLFQKASFAEQLPWLWAPLPGEFQRRSGLVMILSMAIHHKKVPDLKFLDYLPLVEDCIYDDRNFVKKANSWVLRTLGKRSSFLNAEVLQWIEGLSNSKYESNWALRDAWKELSDPKFQARILEREKRKASK